MEQSGFCSSCGKSTEDEAPGPPGASAGKKLPAVIYRKVLEGVAITMWKIWNDSKQPLK